MHWSAGAVTVGTLVLIPGGSYAPASALWLAKANPWGFVVTAVVGVALIAVGLSGVLHEVGHSKKRVRTGILGRDAEQTLLAACSGMDPLALRCPQDPYRVGLYFS